MMYFSIIRFIIVLSIFFAAIFFLKKIATIKSKYFLGIVFGSILILFNLLVGSAFHNNFLPEEFRNSLDILGFISGYLFQTVGLFLLVWGMYKFYKSSVTELSSRYENLINKSLVGVYIIQQNKFKFVNPRFAEIFGYKVEELIDRDIKELVAPESRQLVFENLRKREVEGVESYNYEFAALKKSGEIFYVEVYGLRTVFEGKPAVQGTLIDITERKVAERLLKESENLHKVLFNKITDSIFIFDKETHKFLDCNESAIKKYGYSKEEFLQMTPFDLHPAEEHDIVKSRIDIKNPDKPIRYIHIKKNGEKFYVEIKSDEIDFKGRKAWISSARDVTEQFLYEERIKKISEELKELNSNKDKLFSIISHDLRSPYNSMLGLSEILAEEIETLTPEEIKDYSTEIHNSLKNQYKLIENLLTWANIQTGKMEFVPEILILKDEVDYIFSLVHILAEKKGIRLINSVNDEIKIKADKNMIRSVIQNLISNSCKFTNSGGEVNISAEKLNDDFVKITVKDTGIGMPEDIKNQLFKVGSHFSTKGTNNEKGTGLGLALCNELIEKHGGKINVESQPGKGSEFTFTIPSA